MDAERFDRLTKGLASGVNRRGFLKGVVGAVVGVVGIGSHRSGAAAQTTGNGHECSSDAVCASGNCCPAGSPRVGLCGVPNEGMCGTNNDCCSQSCVEGVCRDRSEGIQGATCDVGDQADCADGFTCCDNYTNEGPDFFCTDTTSDPLNCGGCSQTGGVACGASEVCIAGACQCAPGSILSPITQMCITAGTCPSGPAECTGTNQVCCGPETHKPGQCVGKGRDGGDRACYTSKR